MKRSKVTNKSGLELDFESAVSYMDDDLREELNYNLAPCTDQEFFTAYEKAHEEKIGEKWLLSQSNPTW